MKEGTSEASGRMWREERGGYTRVTGGGVDTIGGIYFRKFILEVLTIVCHDVIIR